jgi:CubicO group peptidase (beta-lactamase class C family)
VVGLLDKEGAHIVVYGKTTKNGKTVNGDTVYEIGSITKVFTAIMLADMALKSKFNLDDPVQKYLPATVTLPTRNNKEITFRNLSQQNSALPRMPNNFNPKDPLNPYADYTPEDMYSFLRPARIWAMPSSSSRTAKISSLAA